MQRKWLRGLATLIAFAAAGTAQHLVTRSPYGESGWALYAFACLLLVAFSRRRSFARGEAPTTSDGATRAPILLGLIAFIAIAVATLVPSTRLPPALGLIAWIAGLALAIVAARTSSRATHQSEAWTTLEVAGLLAVVALAALARFTWIDSLPGRYFDDEARVGQVALEYSRKGIADFFTLGWNAWPVLGLAVQGALGIATDASTTTMRLTSAAFGTLAVATTYLAARNLFSPRVALLAAFILAINRTAIDISRMGTCHAQVMALAPLAFALWWRGINTGLAASFVGAGIVMGLCLYTYNAGQLVIVAWLVFAAHAALSSRNRSAFGRRAILTFAVFCMTIAPLAARVTDQLQFRGTWQQWLALGRGRQVVAEVAGLVQKGDTDAAVAFMRHQASASWLGFFVLPSRAYELGYRNGGMSDDVTAALFALGLALCMFGRLQARGDFLFCWWAVTTLMAGVLTRDPPTFQRLVGVLPAVAILAALPVEIAFDWARDSRRKLRMAGALVAVLALVAVWQNWRTYFVEFARQSLDYPSMLARVLQGLPPEQTVILSGNEYAWYAAGWLQNQLSFQHELMRLNFRDRDLREAADTAGVLPLRPDSNTPPVIVFGPTQVTQGSYLRRLYPGARIRQLGQDHHILAVAEVPMAEIMAWSGLRLRGLSSRGSVDLGVVDPFAPSVDPCTIDPSSPPPPSPKPPSPQALEPPCTIEWSGSIYWPHSTEVEMRLQGDGIEQVLLAGTELPSRRGLTVARVRLPGGWHPFTVRRAAGSVHPWSLQLRSGGATVAMRRSDFMPDASRRGLVGTYTRNEQRLGEVIDTQLNYVADERLLTGRADLRFHLPFDVRWRGKLRIETAGRYQFELQASGDAVLELDGRLLTEIKDVPHERVTTGRGERELSVGLHEIVAAWKARPPYPGTPAVAFQLYWRPTGGEKELVAPTSFEPDATAPVISVSKADWCSNDCQGDGTWTVDEIVRVATIGLGIRQVGSCPAADLSGDGAITIDEIVTAVTQALNGCG